MTVRSAWHINPGQTRTDTRTAPVGTYTPLDATQSRAGVIPGGTGMLLTGTGMTGAVAIGRAIVQGTATQGAYPVAITAAETITVANGHASLPRIDSVFLVAYDQLFDTSGQTLAAVVYTQGTAAATPAAPAAPATGTAYLRLWDIVVPAGASAGAPINWSTALTDRRTYTVAVGGIVSTADAVPGAYIGQYRDNSSTNALERWNGTAWVPVGAWTTYTPTWTAPTTNPSIGNGSITGRYTRIGKTVTAAITLQSGTTTNFGSGFYNFGLPVAANNPGGFVWCGQGIAQHTGAGIYPGIAQLSSGGTSVLVWSDTTSTGATGNPWGNNWPLVWVVNDAFYIQITYETA